MFKDLLIFFIYLFFISANCITAVLSALSDVSLDDGDDAIHTVKIPEILLMIKWLTVLQSSLLDGVVFCILDLRETPHPVRK